MSAARALRFLAGQQGLVAGPGRVEVRTVGDRRVEVHAPVGPARGTVVSLHGMSPLGPRDPRMVRLHGSLAAVGLRVVAPWFPSIAELRIDPRQVTDVARVLHAVTRDPELAPSGRVALFAPSFSGGLALIAAGRPGLAGRVSAVLTVGAFGCIRSTLSAVLTRPDVTDYVWKIVLASHLDLAVGPCPAAKEALRVAALDAWWTGRPPALPAALSRLSASDAMLVRDVLGSAAVRRHHVERILEARPPVLDLLSVVDRVADVEAPVTLLHGVRDRTIPCGQSYRLAEALYAARVPHRLCLTPLLGHGDVVPSVRSLAALPELVRVLGGWLDEVDAGERGGAARAA